MEIDLMYARDAICNVDWFHIILNYSIGFENENTNIPINCLNVKTVLINVDI